MGEFYNRPTVIQMLLCLFIYLFIYSFIYLFIYLFIHLFIDLFIYLFIYLIIYLFIYSLLKVDLHIAYQEPINVDNNTAYISINKLSQ